MRSTARRLAAMVTVGLILATATPVPAAPVVYRVLIVPIDFPDRTGTLDIEELQSKWVDPLVTFWGEVSYGELDLQTTLVPRVSRMDLPRRFFNRGRASVYPMGVCSGTSNGCENACGGNSCDPVGRCAASPGTVCQLDLQCGAGDVCEYDFGFCPDNFTVCRTFADCGGASCSIWTGLCKDDLSISCTSSADCPGTDPDRCAFYREAWQFDDPIRSLVDDGLIDQSPAGLTPPGAPADAVFDAILFVDAIYDDCATCTRLVANRCLLGGVMWTPRFIKADDATTYRVGYASTAWPSDSCVLEPGEWGAAAHEVGHAVAAGRSHPAAYRSAFELMDSAYPCSPGIYTRATPEAVGEGFPVWFPGWIPDDKIVTLEAPVGTTELLAPLETDPASTASPMGLKVEVADGSYYLVECRKNPDPANRTSCYADGMLILHAQEPGILHATNDDVVLLMKPPPGWPADDLWLSHWRPDDAYADTFTDAANDLTITVGPILGDGSCTATVAYGPGSTAPKPDMGIIPWLTEPMNTWETVDIWIDSSCNGYEADDPSDPRRLKYGRRPDTTVVGNGDDACIDHENRIYARVRNLGDAVATDVVVRFERTNPLGVGIRGSDGWLEIGSVDKTHPDAGCLASLAPGAFCDVYVEWTPTSEQVAEAIEVPLEDARFALHSCVRNLIDPVAGEPPVALANQDGNREQENISYFEVRQDPGSGISAVAAGHIFLRNPQMDQGGLADYALSVESELPEGWELVVGEGNASEYRLDSGGTAAIPVSIQAPPGAPLGQSYDVRVEAHRMDEVTAPDGTRAESFFTRVGGALLQARTVIDTSIALGVEVDPPGTCGPAVLTASGCLEPSVSGALLTVDFGGPSGTISGLAEADGSGCFVHQEPIAEPGTWTLQALWPGQDIHSGAVSPVVVAEAFDPDDRDCDGLPNSQDFCPDTPDQGVDSDLDGAGDACDCAPSDPGAFAAPTHVEGLTWLDTDTLTWDDLAGQTGSGTAYSLVTGNLSALPLPGGDGSESCAVGGLSSNVYELSAVPPANTVLWVLVGAYNACGTASLGEGATGPRQTDVCDPCPHDRCTEGAALDPACDACVAQICDQDAYCCATAWDDLCVREVRTICGSLTCPESAGACSHTLCTEGGVLSPGCDDPPITPSCVTDICAVDPFCCSTSWDGLCVTQVDSVCGYNCN